MIRAIAISAVLAAGSATAKQPKELKVGDAAPPLQISEWLKGAPVDVTKGDPDRIYVVEFWATWCRPCHASIPHLSDLQTHFADKKVSVIGISAEDADVVKTFMRALGEKKMRYAVAVDDDAKTNAAYMEAARVPGIPHAFIVKGGKIVWHGHPVEMDDQIVKLTGDKTWAEFKTRAAAAEKKRAELMQRVNGALRAEKWDEAIGLLDELLKLDEKDFDVMAQKYYLLLVKKKNREAAGACGQKLLNEVDNPNLLDAIAFSMLMDDEFASVKDPKFALALAEKAVKLDGTKDPGMLCTLARAKFETGASDEAIRIAEEALQNCKDIQIQQELEASLKTYRNAKSPAKGS